MTTTPDEIVDGLIDGILSTEDAPNQAQRLAAARTVLTLLRREQQSPGAMFKTAPDPHQLDRLLLAARHRIRTAAPGNWS